MIVPTDQMSLAIGKEGQNARLAFKLTGWRIDIKDPESLRDQDLELLRQARAALDEAPDDFAWQGRQPRLVRADGMISVRDREFGPLPADLVGMSVDVEVRGDALEVYYNRELRARYDYANREPNCRSTTSPRRPRSARRAGGRRLARRCRDGDASERTGETARKGTAARSTFRSGCAWSAASDRRSGR